jgi:hypothetical protein
MDYYIRTNRIPYSRNTETTLKESRKLQTREFCITVHQEERRAGRLTKGRTDQNRFQLAMPRTSACLFLDIYDRSTNRKIL